MFKGTDPYIMTLPLGRNIIRHAMVDGVQEMGRDMCGYRLCLTVCNGVLVAEAHKRS